MDSRMGLILPMLFLGLMASLSPATIVVFVLVLGTARARVNAVGFLLGWGISLTIVFAGEHAGDLPTRVSGTRAVRPWLSARSCSVSPCSCSPLGCGGGAGTPCRRPRRNPPAGGRNG